MTTRRDFIRQATLLGAGLSMSPFFINATPGSVGANDKIRVGLIGCKGMGFSDLQAFLRNPEVECIALCDIDDEVLNSRAAETQKITGKKVKNLYKDWRKLIDNKDIDVVIVGTGVGGLFAALNIEPHKKVVLITKSDMESSDSFLAQGGI